VEYLHLWNILYEIEL
jgi:hypothetical protein